MPLLMLATVKERPAVVLVVEDSMVALLTPRALVARSASLLSWTRRRDWRRGRRASSAARRFAFCALLEAASTSRWLGSKAGEPGKPFCCSTGKAILPTHSPAHENATGHVSRAAGRAWLGEMRRLQTSLIWDWQRGRRRGVG
jgi:hypothetical protein